jgi:putative protein kinase ArgK-like GTPase of G3E family
MFATAIRYQSVQQLRRGSIASLAKALTASPSLQQRCFMSTQAVESPEEETHFLLILGPPGGGKGTISKKMLKVS